MPKKKLPTKRIVYEKLPTPEECRLMGIPTPKPGRVTCLKCDREFESPDVRRYRYCPRCRRNIYYNPMGYGPDDYRGRML